MCLEAFFGVVCKGVGWAFKGPRANEGPAKGPMSTCRELLLESQHCVHLTLLRQRAFAHYNLRFDEESKLQSRQSRRH